MDRSRILFIIKQKLQNKRCGYIQRIQTNRKIPVPCCYGPFVKYQSSYQQQHTVHETEHKTGCDRGCQLNILNFFFCDRAQNAESRTQSNENVEHWAGEACLIMEQNESRQKHNQCQTKQRSITVNTTREQLRTVIAMLARPFRAIVTFADKSAMLLPHARTVKPIILLGMRRTIPKKSNRSTNLSARESMIVCCCEMPKWGQ